MSLLNLKQFVSHLNSLNQPLPHYIEQIVKFVNNAHPIIQKIDINNIKNITETPVDIIELTKIAKEYGDYVSAFVNNVNSFKPIYYSIPNEILIKDLNFIKDDTVKNEFFMDDYNGGMLLFKKEIITNDIHRDIKHNFGVFMFKMAKNQVYMSKHSNNSERNGRYHPYHTPNDTLCLGSYKQPYEVAMSTNNFFAAYQLVMQCLTVYGGDELKGKQAGPQNPIELWIGQVCSVCDSAVALDDIKVCGKTKRVICPACVDSTACIDEVDKEIYHPDVLKNCSKCGVLTHTVIRKVCLGCREKAI